VTSACECPFVGKERTFSPGRRNDHSGSNSVIERSANSRRASRCQGRRVRWRQSLMLWRSRWREAVRQTISCKRREDHACSRGSDGYGYRDPRTALSRARAALACHDDGRGVAVRLAGRFGAQEARPTAGNPVPLPGRRSGRCSVQHAPKRIADALLRVKAARGAAGRCFNYAPFPQRRSSRMGRHPMIRRETAGRGFAGSIAASPSLVGARIRRFRPFRRAHAHAALIFLPETRTPQAIR
jgi:hypothetical protein